jgi:hypothetical protein
MPAATPLASAQAQAQTQSQGSGGERPGQRQDLQQGAWRPAAPAATPSGSAELLARPAPAQVISTPAGASQAPLLGQGVGMQDMIEGIRATVDLATRQGLAQARIALAPADLGDIRIHLSQTADGLLVRVTADTPVAAQALSQGRAELHQSLSTLGTTLLRLDIGSSGQPQAEQREGRFPQGSDEPTPSATPAAPQEEESPQNPVAPATPMLAGMSPGGLVDVLA